ncbi:MAG: hypothetical protein OEX08_00220 [Candidatus Nomurabacteria bacterium]|nr:hypothetical protein [Candidatus Nomurabacteria bacterium]
MNKETKDKKFTKVISGLMQRYFDGQEINLNQLSMIARKGEIKITEKILYSKENLFKKGKSFEFEGKKYTVLEILGEAITQSLLKYIATEFEILDEKEGDNFNRDGFLDKIKNYAWFKNCIKQNTKKKTRLSVVVSKFSNLNETISYYFLAYKFRARPAPGEHTLHPYGSRFSPSVPSILNPGDILIVLEKK